MKNKKELLYSGILLIAIALAIAANCLGCGATSSQSDAVSNSEAAAAVDNTNEVGNVDTGDVSVSGVTVAGDTITNAAAVTVWELVDNVQSDWYWRSMLIVFILLWATGNLHPAKALKIRDSK